MKNIKNFNHKELWFESMVGMTWGFFSTLIVGTIMGIFSKIPHFELFKDIKDIMSFITGFGIGIGIGMKLKFEPMKIFAIGLSAFFISRSNFVPYLSDELIIFKPKDASYNTSLGLPGDVFAAYFGSVLMIYFFKTFNFKTYIDIIIMPVIGIALSLIFSFSLTYITTFILVLLQLLIIKINLSESWIILTSPIIGSLMGLALSLPTSSAAIAFAIHLDGPAATAALIGTSAQMVSFGVMTYLSNKKISIAAAVGFGSSMLQIKNFTRKPSLLLIATLVSAISALIGTAIFMDLGLNDKSVTSGMGTCALYGQIFLLFEAGWGNVNAWLSIILLQFTLPILITIALYFVGKNKLSLFSDDDLILEIN